MLGRTASETTAKTMGVPRESWRRAFTLWAWTSVDMACSRPGQPNADRRLLDLARGTAKMLGIEEIRAVFDGVQAMLNDMRMVSSGSTLEHRDMNSSSAAETAIVMVDLVLNGTLDRMALLSTGLERDAFFARWHELPEDLGADAGKLFNSADVALLFMQSRSG